MLEKHLLEVAAQLEKLRVRYALIGGLAVIARGFVRATKDVDFLIDFPLHQAASLTQLLNEAGLHAVFAKGDADDPILGIIRVTFSTPEEPIQCDILFPSRGWQGEAVRSATSVNLGEFDVPVVRTEDLFLLKLYAGGPQDLLDAAQLLKLQTKGERRRWKVRAAKIGRSRMYDRCLKFIAEGI